MIFPRSWNKINAKGGKKEQSIQNSQWKGLDRKTDTHYYNGILLIWYVGTVGRKTENVTEFSWIVAFYGLYLLLSLFCKFSNNENLFYTFKKKYALKNVDRGYLT